MSREQFFVTMQPYAMVSSAMTGGKVKPSVFLALWAHESAFGESKLARTGLNYGGHSDSDGKPNSWSKAIGFVPRPSNEGAFYRQYASVSDFAYDAGKIFTWSYYTDVRNATTATEQIKELGRSPYAVDPGHGDKILTVWNTYNLSKYDSKAVVEGSDVIKKVTESMDIPDDLAKQVGILITTAIVLVLGSSLAD